MGEMRRLNVQVPLELHRKIKTAAAQRDSNIRDLVLEALKVYFEKDRATAKAGWGVLTEKEKEAARSAKSFLATKWGVVKKDGTILLWPAAMVAQLRGVEFHRNQRGALVPDKTAALIMALEDVQNWLGFLSDDAYCSALRRERRKIFNRATY